MSSLPTALLPDDEAAAYHALVSRVVNHFHPAGEDERALVQAIADTDWRLGRIPALEAGIYAVGRREFAALYADEQDDRLRRQLVDAKVFLTYQRQLSNLSVQEARLRRQREQDVKALHALQEARKRKRDARLDQAAHAYIDAVYEERYENWEPGSHGFDFSMDEVELRAMDLDHNLFAGYEKELAEKWKQRRGAATRSAQLPSNRAASASERLKPVHCKSEHVQKTVDTRAGWPHTRI